MSGSQHAGAQHAGGAGGAGLPGGRVRLFGGGAHIARARGASWLRRYIFATTARLAPAFVPASVVLLGLGRLLAIRLDCPTVLVDCPAARRAHSAGSPGSSPGSFSALSPRGLGRRLVLLLVDADPLTVHKAETARALLVDRRSALSDPVAPIDTFQQAGSAQESVKNVSLAARWWLKAMGGRKGVGSHLQGVRTGLVP